MKNRYLGAILIALLPALSNAQGMRIPEPTAGLMPNPTQGKALFEQNCAKCHGTALTGSDQGPPLLHRVYQPSHHSNASFQLAARYGARAHHWQFGDMPAVPAVTPDDVAHITAYVRMQQRRAGIE